jgi:hypothetical protein
MVATPPIAAFQNPESMHHQKPRLEHNRTRPCKTARQFQPCSQALPATHLKAEMPRAWLSCMGKIGISQPSLEDGVTASPAGYTSCCCW